MFIFRLVGFVVLFHEYASLVSGELKCEENKYKDGATNICMPCNACCPPRPQNQFCKRDCDLNNTCREPEKPALKNWQIIVITVSIVVFGFVVVVSVLKRKSISQLFQRHCKRRTEGVQDTNSPNDPRQQQVVSCHDVDSAPLTNGLQVQTVPLVGNNPDAVKASRQNPAQDKFHSIPAGLLHTFDHVSTPYVSLPLPPFLEKDGIKFIREDIVMARPNPCLPLLDTQLDSEDGDEGIDIWPNVDSRPRGPASISPEKSRLPTTTSVQCTEDLNDTVDPGESSRMETLVKTYA